MRFASYVSVAALAAALSGSALAADLPARAPAPAPVYAAPIFTWTGFYVGAQAGYAWGRASTLDVDGYNGPPNVTHKPDGWTGGLYAGYNYQISSIVLGAELEAGYLGLKGAAQYGPYVGVRLPTDSRAATHADWYGAVTGRVGLALNNWLLYAKGGYAWTGVKSSFIDSDPAGTTLVSGTRTGTRDGWLLGGGVEYAFSNNWSARLEYAHIDFGKKTHTAVTFGGAPFRFRHKLNADIVRVGLSYKFGGPSAVVAKY